MGGQRRGAAVSWLGGSMAVALMLAGEQAAEGLSSWLVRGLVGEAGKRGCHNALLASCECGAAAESTLLRATPSTLLPPNPPLSLPLAGDHSMVALQPYMAAVLVNTSVTRCRRRPNSSWSIARIVPSRLTD